MKLHVTFYTGEVKEYSLDQSKFTIGRSNRADLQISDDGISRTHCEIEVTDDGEIYITDLNSTNGVQVDGKSIPAGQRVLYNTFLALSLGPIQSITFELEQVSPVISSLNSPTPKIKESTSRTMTRNQTGDKTTSFKNKNFKASKEPKSNTNDKNQMVKMIVTIILCLAVGLILYSYSQMNSDEEKLPIPTTKIEF